MVRWKLGRDICAVIKCDLSALLSADVIVCIELGLGWLIRHWFGTSCIDVSL